MIQPAPATLEGHGVRLEPMSREHEKGLAEAAKDGKLWELWYTSVPAPGETAAYIDAALKGRQDGHMLPWVVFQGGTIVGSTRYHDIIAAADRVEIGYTWYAQRCQRTHVNTACKLLLFAYGPTTSTSARSAPSRRWGRRRTASSATIGRAETAASATRSCIACWRPNGRM
jgi:hypothetical protein